MTSRPRCFPVALPSALPVALTSLTALAALLAGARPAQAQCYAEPERGFPVFVRSADGSIDDTDFLTAAARAIAYRWQVPTSNPNAFREWARVHDRQVPPEPRWSDDWIPGDEHRAQVAMVIYRDGRLKGAPPKPASGDEAFDGSLKSIIDEPLPGGPKLPDFPKSVKADSVVLAVFFGGDDQPQPNGLVRFAQVQTQATPDRSAFEAGGDPPPGGVASGRGGRGRPAPEGGPPRGGGERTRRAIVKFDVLATGEVRPESIEVLESADATMTTLIKANLIRGRFTPATQNCKPVTLTIVRIF